MPKDNPELKPINLGNVARGAAIELFELNIEKIAANIADTKTAATAKRKLVLTFVFEPDADRSGIDVTTTAEVRLAAVERHSSRVFLGKDSKGHAYVFPVDPRQMALYDPPPPDEKLIQFGIAGQKPE